MSTMYVCEEYYTVLWDFILKGSLTFKLNTCKFFDLKECQLLRSTIRTLCHNFFGIFCV